MDKTIVNIFKVISVLLIVAAALFIVLVAVKGEDAIKTDLSAQALVLNVGFYATYIALGLCASAAVLFPIYLMIQHPKAALRALVGIGVIALVLLLSWVFASSDITGEVYEKFAVSTVKSKVVGGGLIATYVLGFGAVAATVYSGVSKMFK